MRRQASHRVLNTKVKHPVRHQKFTSKYLSSPCYEIPFSSYIYITDHSVHYIGKQARDDRVEVRITPDANGGRPNREMLKSNSENSDAFRFCPDQNSETTNIALRQNTRNASQHQVPSIRQFTVRALPR